MIERLEKRKEKRAKAEADLKNATAAEEKNDVDKFSKRLVRVTSQHNEDCKKLLRLMGVPVVDGGDVVKRVALTTTDLVDTALVSSVTSVSSVFYVGLREAPSEAEAQCAALAKDGAVYGTATEDMDALTFQTPKLLRRMTFSGASQPIMEIDYQKLLQGLDLSHENFVDLCILCGCDYTGSVKGIGPKKALNLIRQHGTIEEILKNLDASKYPVPDDWLETAERIKKRKAMRKEAKDRKEARAKEEAKDKAKAVQEADSGVSKEEGEGNDAIEEGKSATITMQGSGKETAADKTADGRADDGEDKDSTQGVDSKAKRSRKEEEEDEDDVEETPPMYRQARGLFLAPEVMPADACKLKWTDPDEAGLEKFLVEGMGFNAERVKSGIAKLKNARKNVSQKRMDSFFSVIPNPNASSKAKPKPKPAQKGKGGVGAKGKGKKR